MILIYCLIFVLVIAVLVKYRWNNYRRISLWESMWELFFINENMSSFENELGLNRQPIITDVQNCQPMPSTFRSGEMKIPALMEEVDRLHANELKSAHANSNCRSKIILSHLATENEELTSEKTPIAMKYDSCNFKSPSYDSGDSNINMMSLSMNCFDKPSKENEASRPLTDEVKHGINEVSTKTEDSYSSESRNESNSMKDCKGKSSHIMDIIEIYEQCVKKKKIHAKNVKKSPAKTGKKEKSPAKTVKKATAKNVKKF